MNDYNETCIICGSPSSNTAVSDRPMTSIKCTICGNFIISDEAETYYGNNQEQDWIPLISYWIKSHQAKKPIEILRLTIKSIIDTTQLPKVKEQADNLLLWIGENVQKPNGYTLIPINYLIPIVGAVDEANVIYIAEYLKKQGYINHKDFQYSVITKKPAIKDLDAQMTFKGWDKYDELKRTSKDSRLAFMAMKFNNSALAKIFNEVIKDAVAKTGFEIRRLDEEKRAGIIDDKLRVEIRRSKFLIADLTDDNNGAYWEAGYAEGLGMQVIYICEEEKFKEKKTHFDTNHHLTVLWKDNQESLKNFAEELKATIRATFFMEAKMED